MDTGIIGPVTVMPDYISRFGAHSAIVHGAIISSILVPAAISSFFAGHVADLLGRRKCIAVGALIFGIGTALEAGAVRLAMFVVGRCIEGLGEGFYLGTLVVYICEITPPSRRGPLTAGPQLLLTFGLLTGYFTCYGTVNMGSSFSWRTPFIILASLSLSFSVASFLWLIPSPRWLTLKGRQTQAASSWDRLQVDEKDREETEIDGQVENDAQSCQKDMKSASENEQEKALPHDGRLRNHKTENEFFDVFSHNVRGRTFLAVFIMGMQQFSGIDGVLYYAPIIFQQAGISSSEASFLASGVSAIVIMAATIPATIFADKWGRRASMVWGGLSMGVAMLLIGALYAANTVHADTGAARWVVIVTVYIYVILYCVTWSISCKIFVAEVQPQHTRASATNLAHGSNWVANFAVALTTPVLLQRSSFGAYILWAGCLLLTAVVCLVFMPETKGRSLEDIEAAFRKETMGSRAWRKMHVRYTFSQARN
ncbi:MAG: hypothetical protein Q9227_006657 [Pyrenula ochraceoflavens]